MPLHVSFHAASSPKFEIPILKLLQCSVGPDTPAVQECLAAITRKRLQPHIISVATLLAKHDINRRSILKPDLGQTWTLGLINHL